MTVLRNASGPAEQSTAVPHESAFANLLDEKAWQHLGLTGEEFKRRWYAGDFRDDKRASVIALDGFMRTGTWQECPPGIG